MNDETIDIVDAHDHVTNSASKIEAHRHGWLHRTVIGEVRDPAGKIVLVRQASDRQDAGKLVVPVGGHVKAGESSDKALAREAWEEIGIKDIKFTYIDKFIYDRHIIGRHENHFFIIYQIIANPLLFVLGPEAVEHKSFTVEELQTALTVTPEIFAPSYLILLTNCFPDLLPRL